MKVTVYKTQTPLYSHFVAAQRINRAFSMDITREPNPVPARTATRSLTASKLTNILWDSAIEAAIKAFLVLILGSVALSVVGGVFQEMIPSAPPVGIEDSPHASHHWLGGWNWRAPLKKDGLVLLSCLFFVPLVSVRMAHYSTNPRHRRAAAWLLRQGQRVSHHWFSFIVGNAFGAWVSTIAFGWLSRFSWTQWLWPTLAASFGPVLRTIADTLLGAERLDSIRAFFGWYDANQLKFTFWFFFLAAMCD